MTGRVDDGKAPLAQAEPHARRVDRDGLIAFVLQRVERERPLGREATPPAARDDLRDACGRQRAGVVQQAADQRRLAVIDVAENDDACVGAHMYPPVRSRSNDASLS